MNHLDVWLDDESLGGSSLVGHLHRTESRTGETISFEYNASWLAGAGPVPAFPLDPELVLAAGPQFAKAGASALTAVFQDCSPDRWGKRLMDRREAIEARESGRKPRLLRAWDYLVGVHDEGRMGALRLLEPQSARYVDDRELSAPPITELRRLEGVAAAVEAGDADLSDEMVRWLRQLIAPGASLGGARPKASFTDANGRLWLAKFPSGEDRVDVGLWEFLAHELAVAAGVDTPPAKRMKLSERGHTFAVQRFDRTPSSRRMYNSAMTQLDASPSEGHSYLDLVAAIENSGTPGQIARNLEQLFRRALFNILIGNRDDHLRNHGFLRDRDGWRLAPAFDVNPNPDKDHHVLAIDAHDPSPDSRLLLATAEYYRLADANGIANQVRDAVRGWEARARRHGASTGEIALMQGVIDPER